jgi:hypothetical protein
MKMAEKLKLISWRDIVFVALPSLFLAIGAFWLAAQFIKPAPPDQLVISTGGDSGAYQIFAAPLQGRAGALRHYAGGEAIRRVNGKPGAPARSGVRGRCCVHPGRHGASQRR